MAWFGKSKSKDKNAKTPDQQASRPTVPNKGERTGGGSTEGSSKGQRPGSADIRAQALANARMARETIGDEALQKIAAAIRKKQTSALEQAKAKIAQTDADRVAEEILAMLETRH